MKEYKPAGQDAITQNRWDKWVPAIPEPWHWTIKKECMLCDEMYWSYEAYRGHYALRHILGL